eukprot:2714906-Pyramimonas_sp.AAC.1
MAAASLSKRARFLAEAAPDLAAVAQEAAQASAADPVRPAATVVAAVSKREAEVRERNLAGAKAAAKARSVQEKKVLRSATPGPVGCDAYLAPARPPVLMLIRRAETTALHKAQRLRVQLAHDPVDFVRRLAKQDSRAAQRKGNVGVPFRHGRHRHRRPDCSSVHGSFLHDAH